MSEIKAGQSIGGRYKAIKLLGEGGFGEVWKAEDESLGRMIALKLVSGEKLERSTPEQQAEFIERFKREARILASLRHIHILPLFDYGESEGLRYLVIPLHEGGTLESRLQRGNFTLGDTDRYFTQLAEALDYAHKQKIIHRDLKPSNVLLDENGNGQLSDFGISKLIEESAARLTQTGTAIGTPDYMSPEQFKGLPLDGRSDIYSLGVILYEMAVGRPPFEADNKWTLAQKHIAEMPPLPSSLNSNLTPEIDEVILKAMAKDANDRFNSPAEFLSAWKQAIGQPEVARSVAPTDSHMPAFNVKSDTAKNPIAGLTPLIIAGVGALVLVALLVVGGVVMFSGSTTPTAGVTQVSSTKVAATGAPTNTTAPTPTAPASPTPDLPRLSGSGQANNIFAEAESAIGSSVVKVAFENKNTVNYSIQVSTSSGQGKSAVLQQPSGFQFPTKMEKDFVSLSPTQKGNIEIPFAVRINANDKLIFQWVAADTGGNVSITIVLAPPK
jgi:serine/threonine-protein kinase